MVLAGEAIVKTFKGKGRKLETNKEKKI